MSFNLSLYRNLKRKIDLYLSVKQYEPSRELLENKLSAHPRDARLRKLLALVYSYQNRTDEAISLLKKLQKEEQEDKEASLLLMVLYCDLGSYAEARSEYLNLQENSSPLLGKSLSVERLSEEFISCGITFYKSNLFSRAIVQFSQALTLCPDSSEAVVCLAKAQVKLKNYTKACHLLKNFCKAHQPSADVSLWLGLIYFELGRRSLANFHLEKAKELNPESRLAELYLKYLNAGDSS